MPYNAIWIINLLNEDEFDIQNYLYPGDSMDNTVQDLRALYHTIVELFIQFISKIITSLSLCRILSLRIFCLFLALLRYKIIFFWPKWYFGHRNLDTPSWVTSAWSFYTFLPANSWAAFPPRRPWVSASNYTVLFYQSGIYFDREFETIADNI